MNKTISLLCISMLVLIASCRTDDDGQAKKEELKNLVIDYYNALANKDLEKANTLTTSNFVLWDAGLIYDNKIAIDSVALKPAFKFSTTIDSLNVHVDKKDASAYYFRTAEFTFSDSVQLSARFLESATFNKQGETWKLRFLHSTPRK